MIECWLLRRLCRIVAIVFFTANIISCAPSQRAINALNNGNTFEFCKISAESVQSDRYSINNMGLCYENGWGGYSKNIEFAVQAYTLAARWGITQAQTNLRRLNLPVPEPDFAMAEEAKRNAALGALLGVAVLGLAAAMASKGGNSTSPYYGNSVSGFAPRNQIYNDYSGCCSWHGGIARSYAGAIMCDLFNRVMCSDGEPSPTCVCP